MSEIPDDAARVAHPIPVRRRGARVLALGCLFALVPASLAVDGALRIQVGAAAAGALAATLGLGLATASWPRRRSSDLHHLGFGAGVFLACAGAIGMLAGIGLYH